MSSRPRFAMLICVALFRAFAVIGVVQISGLAHIAADVVAMVDEGHHPDGDDCDEHDCPPGCPSCHHAHGGAIPVAPAIVSLLPTPSLNEVSPSPRAEHSPPQRSIAPPDRPPRA